MNEIEFKARKFKKYLLINCFYDIKFDKSNENKTINTKLNKGLYKLKCLDNYGDGGLEGHIKQDNQTILNFKWNSINR